VDLWQLKVFCKVVDLGSFSKAGKAIHISQPTVSSHVKDLESHFGVQLLDRLARKTVPTKAGELLHGYARRLLSLYDEAETAMAEYQGIRRGTLHIGGSTIPGGYLLPSIIGDFASHYPEISIYLEIGDTHGIIEKVAAGEVELGVVGAKSNQKNITQTKLIEDVMRLVVPANHKWADRSRIHFNALKREPFIAREPGSGTLSSINLSLQKKGLSTDSLKIIARMGSTQAIRQGIKSGAGISILSTIAVREDVNQGTLRMLNIEGLNLQRSFYLTLQKQRSISPLGQLFIKFLRNALHV